MSASIELGLPRLCRNAQARRTETGTSSVTHSAPMYGYPSRIPCIGLEEHRPIKPLDHNAPSS
jgi:hypothetical protein